MLWLLIVSVVAVCALLAVKYRRATRPDALTRAKWQADELIRTAKIRMEEAVGLRRPGERRISDSLSNWRRML